MKLNKILFAITLLLVVRGIIFAGTTGKIKGKISLKENGEPAIGANIVLDGTSYGASSDIEGLYTILNVPVGIYTIKASFIGYHAPDVANIRISADLTTELNFELVAQDVELPVVQIFAERPLVNKSATNAVRIVTAEDMQALPVRGLAGIFAIQPGVVVQNNNLYIRGGREDEVGYYVEGATSRNVVTGQNAIRLVPESVEDFQIQAGGYNAEYGGANAGIIRQQLRSGTSNIKASYSFETDKLNAENKNDFLKTYSYGYYNHVLTLSGPVYQDKIKFFFAGENQFMRDRNPSFWDNGFEFPNSTFPGALVDGPDGTRPGDTLWSAGNGGNAPASSLNPKLGAIQIPNGMVPHNSLNRWAANGTVTFDFNPFRLKLGAVMSWEQRLINGLPVIAALNTARLPIDDQSSGLYNLKFTHLVKPTTFYEVNVNYFDNRRKRYDPDLEDNILAYGDSIEAAKHGYTFWSYSDASVGFSPADARYYAFPFARFGQLIVGGSGAIPANVGSRYLKQKQTYIGGSIDLTHLEGAHEFKVGLSWQRYTVRNYSIGNLENVFFSYYSKPDSARDPAASANIIRTGGRPDNYGYDLYGNESDNGLEGPKHPTFFAVYLQDKIEFKDLIVNAGLRLDRFDNDDQDFLDAKNPQFLNNDVFNIDPATFKKKEPFYGLSPRLGLSFPVTDRTVFHMQYGKFIQSPSLNNIYLGGPQVALNVSGRNFIAAPVGFGLDPERTTQYEIGFTQQISDFASFDITGFYKDIKGQIQAVKIQTTPGGLAKAYSALQNGDFATTKGFELAITLRRVQRVQAKFNYTLSDAQGTGSTSNGAIGSVEQGTLTPTLISPLTFNQAHRGALNLDYHFAKGDGGPILERLGANLLFSFNSGHNYTKVFGGLGQTGPEDGGILYDGDPRNRKPLEPLNSSTTPWNFSFDFRIDKTVNISNLFDVNFYFYVQNLLNTENVINVYGRTGNAEDDGFLSNPDLSDNIINAPGRGDGYVAMYRAVNLGLRQHYAKNQGGDLFGTPRQIRFGLRIEY